MYVRYVQLTHDFNPNLSPNPTQPNPAQPFTLWLCSNECLSFAAVYPDRKSGLKRESEPILHVPSPVPTALLDSGHSSAGGCGGSSAPWALPLHVLPHNYTLLRDRSDGSLSCRNCGKTFSITSNMLRHRRQCEGRGHLMCRFCGQQFARRDKYTRHMSLKHGEDVNTRARFSESEMDRFVAERDVSERSRGVREGGDVTRGMKSSSQSSSRSPPPE